MERIMKKITIEFINGSIKIDQDGIEKYTELFMALATLEGMVGAITELDKPELREVIDEVQTTLNGVDTVGEENCQKDAP